MYEHFVPSRPYIPHGDQLAVFMSDEHFPGGLIDEIHVDFCRYNTAMYNRSLAAFLIGASEYSYYACTEGWAYRMGWRHWSPDYDRPLGQPNGRATKTKTGWTRTFASGTRVRAVYPNSGYRYNAVGGQSEGDREGMGRVKDMVVRMRLGVAMQGGMKR